MGRHTHTHAANIKPERTTKRKKPFLYVGIPISQTWRSVTTQPTRDIPPFTAIVTRRPKHPEPSSHHRNFHTASIAHAHAHAHAHAQVRTSAPSACRTIAVYTSPSVSVLLTTANHSDRSGVSAWSAGCVECGKSAGDNSGERP